MFVTMSWSLVAAATSKMISEKDSSAAGDEELPGGCCISPVPDTLAGAVDSSLTGCQTSPECWQQLPRLTAASGGW